MYIEVLEVADVTISLFMVIAPKAFHVCVQLNLLMKHLKLYIK